MGKRGFCDVYRDKSRGNVDSDFYRNKIMGNVDSVIFIGIKCSHSPQFPTFPRIL